MRRTPGRPPATLMDRVDRATRYVRARDLPLLLPVWPADLADTSAAGRERIVRLLRRALRAERARGLAGHWTYDLARHAQLRAAFDAERADAIAANPARARQRAASNDKKARC